MANQPTVQLGSDKDPTAGDTYKPVDDMTGRNNVATDVIRLGNTVFNDWDAQSIWRFVLAPLKDNGLTVTAAGNHWKSLSVVLAGSKAANHPPMARGLLDDLVDLAQPVVGPDSGWVGQAPTQFEKAIEKLGKYATDLAERASLNLPETSMASTAEVIAGQMRVVWDRVSASPFTNNGAPWEDYLRTHRNDFFEKVTPDGWVEWAAQQHVPVYERNRRLGPPTFKFNLNGRQWELWTAGKWSGQPIGDFARAYAVDQFGKLMQEAKLRWLNRSQKVQFVGAAMYLQDLFTKLHPYIPVAPKAEGLPGQKDPLGVPGVDTGPMPELPTYDSGTGLPTPNDVVGNLDTAGLTPGMDAADNLLPYADNPFSPAGDGTLLPPGVITGDPLADIGTDTASFNPTPLGPLADSLGALSPAGAAGAFGAGGPGTLGAFGTSGDGALMGPSGRVGTGPGLGAVAGPGAASGIGPGGRMGPGAAVPGAAGVGGRSGGMPMMPMMPPMHPGMMGGQGQEDPTGNNNLDDDGFFAVDVECTDAVIGEQATEPAASGWDESSGFKFAR